MLAPWTLLSGYLHHRHQQPWDLSYRVNGASSSRRKDFSYLHTFCDDKWWKMPIFGWVPKNKFNIAKVKTQWYVPLWFKHDDVLKWKQFPHYWLLAICVGNSPSSHKGQWRGTLMFSLICVWINGWANNREAGDLRRYHAHYDIIVMHCLKPWYSWVCSMILYAAISYNINFDDDAWLLVWLAGLFHCQRLVKAALGI